VIPVPSLAKSCPEGFVIEQSHQGIREGTGITTVHH
jgi:hypothetical protein